MRPPPPQCSPNFLPPSPPKTWRAQQAAIATAAGRAAAAICSTNVSAGGLSVSPAAAFPIASPFSFSFPPPAPARLNAAQRANRPTKTTHHPRRFPVILVTGTPGTGKTLHAQLLASELDAESGTPLVHLNIGDIVKAQGFHEGWDDEWQSYTVDEDRLLDYLEEVVNPRDAPAETGFILDHHDPGLFPERWIDLAVVLTADNTVLHERLTARNYPENKITENITAEIMMTCLTETRESYAPEIIVELKSDGSSDAQVDDNVRRIAQWVGTWCSDRAAGVHDE